MLSDNSKIEPNFGQSCTSIIALVTLQEQSPTVGQILLNLLSKKINLKRPKCILKKFWGRVNLKRSKKVQGYGHLVTDEEKRLVLEKYFFFVKRNIKYVRVEFISIFFWKHVFFTFYDAGNLKGESESAKNLSFQSVNEFCVFFFTKPISIL